MRGEVNPYVGVNFIGDNPKMAVPPKYWLQRLFDFDADLVVLPSRQRPFAYVLARRARRSAGLMPAGVLETTSDAGMCAKYGLVPVSLIYRQGSAWSIDNILRDLASRDIWKAGGPSKAADILDANDIAAEQETKRNIRKDLDYRGKDAWKSYQARTGQRTKLVNRPQPLEAP